MCVCCHSFILEQHYWKKLELFKLNLQRGEWPSVSICCWSCGLGASMQSPHSASQWSFLQVFYIHFSGVYMSSVLYCLAKPVNICPCFTCKIVLLSDSPLSSSTPTYFSHSSSFIIIIFHSSAFISSTFYFRSLLSFHFLSSFSQSLGTGALCTIVMATTMGRQDGGVIAGLASFTGEDPVCENTRCYLLHYLSEI